MKIKIHEIAVFETRRIPDPDSPSNFTVKKRGWWWKQTGEFLGSNFLSASDLLQMKPQYEGYDVVK